MIAEEPSENYGMGWISLYRSIKKHWIFENDKFFKWWIIILFEVNHSETKVNIGYNIYELHKGQSAKSIRTWANLFNCGTKQATKFFDLLEKDNMITREILGKGKQSSTLINVTNYNEYQTQEKRNVPINGNARETQGKRNRHTDNNYNNYNNENNTYSKFDFFEDWNELRTKHLKMPSHIKSFSTYDHSEFKKLCEDYTREDFRNALIGLFKQKKLPNDSTSMQSNPTHFLKFFNSYLTAFHDQNASLYGKKQMQE